LSYRINWDARAICIEGARGTGKSTIMLQQIKENLSQDKTLYLSLDDLYFKEHNLIDVAEKFYNLGGRHLFIDEVHKYQDWQQSVKNIYDFYPELQIVVSGSSILELQKSQADLSRRLLRYDLPELSLREYIALKHKIKLPEYSLEAILTQHSEITSEIQKQIPSPLAVLGDYLSFGAYPFFMEGESDYFMRLNQLINVIIDYDLPEAKAIAVTTQAKLKKLLYIISTSVPFQPNISRLAQKTETSRIRLLEMLHILEQAQLIRNLRSSAHGVSLMNKPSKIFLRNTNLIAALSEGNPNAGNIRETFFLSQVQNSGGVVTYSKKGDFLLNEKFLFEVGGKNKNSSQIKEHPSSFIVADEIEHGWQNKIPLWLFGFLY
jgi:predicted AAA+ superfamily ATPase